TLFAYNNDGVSINLYCHTPTNYIFTFSLLHICFYLNKISYFLFFLVFFYFFFVYVLFEYNAGGSGFKSLKNYRSGYFGTYMKLQPGYTAGIITSFYLSNNQDYPGNHDEIDIEFLGTTPNKPYILQTNVYIRGSGDGNIIGREMKFHLWFDPTKDFHNYAILWDPNEIIFFVDDIPIRRYLKKNDATFPERPMYVYGSIWDASSWATEEGRIKADYRYQPFVGKYSNNFKLEGCEANESPSCRRAPSSSPGWWAESSADRGYVVGAEEL
ncbi:Xyloglucan endotransglucosylase/hydrolase protein 31, partial [Capsicum annuum]